MRKAHLLEPPKFDISRLYTKYEVKMVFDSSLDVRGYVSHPDELYSEMRNWAERCFDPKSDCFVLTGNQTLLVVCSMALQSAHPMSRIRFLRFDAHSQDYVEFSIDERSQATSVGCVSTDTPYAPRHIPQADSA